MVDFFDIVFLICLIASIFLNVFTLKRKREMLDKLNTTNQQLIHSIKEFQKRKK